MLLNGASSPQPLKWQAGLTYRLRFININGNNTVKITLDQKGAPLSWRSIAKDGADLPPEQSITSAASFLIAPGETYDFQFRPEESGDLQLTLFLPLFKETVTQAIQVGSGSP